MKTEIPVSAGESSRTFDAHADGLRPSLDSAVNYPRRTAAEQRLAMQYSVARVLAEASSLEEAASPILECICRQDGWDFGALWLVDEPVGQLRCQCHYSGGPALEDFVADTVPRGFAKGFGLPGRVWQSGAPAWISSIRSADNFPRQAGAAASGLASGFAFPIRLGNTVLGVLEFFSRQERKADDDLLRMTDAAGTQLGQFIERKKADQTSARLAAIVASSADAIIGKDRDGTITTWNQGAEEIFGYTAEEAIGRPISMLIPPDRRQEDEAVLAAFYRGERIGHYETVRLRKDGTRVEVSLAVSPIRDTGGNVVGASKIARDITARKQMERTLQAREQELRASGERLSAALIAGGTGTFRWDIRSSEVEWDGSLGPLFGLPAQARRLPLDEFVGMVHPDDRASVRAACQRVLEGADFNLEFRAVWPNGTVHWLSDRGTCVRDEHGRPAYMVGACVDVTARRRSEAQVREQRDILQAIVAGAPLNEILDRLTAGIESLSEEPVIATILLLSADGRRLNPAAGRSAPPGWTALLQNLEIGPGVGSCGTAAFHGQRVIVPEIQADPRWEGFRSKAASFGLASCWSTPIRSSAGKVLGTFAVYGSRPRIPSETEIEYVELLAGTAALAIEHLRSEQAVRESELRFRALADAAPMLIRVFEPGGRCSYVNKAWLEYTGQTLEQALADGWISRVHPADAETCALAHRQLLDRREPFQLEYRLLRADGQYRWMLDRARPREFFQESFPGYIAGCVDIDDQKEIEQMLERLVSDRTALLREAVADLEAFAYSVSHDLRAPLRAMNAYAVALLEDYRESLPPDALGYLEKLARSADRMDRLTQDVLAVAGVSKNEVQLSTVDLGALLEDILDQIPEAEGRITIETPLGAARAHEGLLAQVFTNFIRNALKFAREGVPPQIVISSRLEEEFLRVQVRDNGIGIPADYQREIFQIFYRVNPRSRFEGTGIGLSIVKAAASKMGGRVGVQSDGATGSTFWIELPGGRL